MPLTRSLYRKILKKVDKISKNNSCKSSSSNDQQQQLSSSVLISAAFLNLFPPEAVLEYCYLKLQNSNNTKDNNNDNKLVDLESCPKQVTKILFRDAIEQLNHKLAILSKSPSSSSSDEKVNSASSASMKNKLQKDHLLYGFEAVRRLSLMDEAEQKSALTTKTPKTSEDQQSTTSKNFDVITSDTVLKYPQILCVETKMSRVFDLPRFDLRHTSAAVACDTHLSASYCLQTSPQDDESLLEGLPADIKQKLMKEEEDDEKAKSASSTAAEGKSGEKKNKTSATADSSSSSNSKVLKPWTLYRQLVEKQVEPLWTRTFYLDKETLPLPPDLLISIMKISTSQRSHTRIVSPIDEAKQKKNQEDKSSNNKNENDDKQDQTNTRSNNNNRSDVFVADAMTRGQLKAILCVNSPIKIPEEILKRKQNLKTDADVEDEDVLYNDGEDRNLFGHVRVSCSTKCHDLAAEMTEKEALQQELRQQQQQQNPESTFRYKVRIENNSKEFSIMVMTRHWHFVDLNKQRNGAGVLTEVAGPGLVGYMPFLEPTAATSYESGTSLQKSLLVESSSSSEKKYDIAEGIMIGKFQCVAIPKTDYAKKFCPGSGFQFDVDVGPVYLNSNATEYEKFPPTMSGLTNGVFEFGNGTPVSDDDDDDDDDDEEE